MILADIFYDFGVQCFVVKTTFLSAPQIFFIDLFHLFSLPNSDMIVQILLSSPIICESAGKGSATNNM